MRVFFTFLGFVVLGCGADAATETGTGEPSGTGGQAVVSTGGAASGGAAGQLQVTGGATGAGGAGSGGAASLACKTDADCSGGWLCAAVVGYAGVDPTPLCRKPCISPNHIGLNRSDDCPNVDDFCSAVVAGAFVNNCEGNGAPRACAGTNGPDRGSCPF